MRTFFGAVIGALTVGAVLVSYDLGERRAFSHDAMAMAAGYQPGQQYPGQPYLVQAGQAGQVGYVSPYAPYAPQYAAPYAYGTAAPMVAYPAPQYVSERVVTQPAVRRAATQRVVTEPAKPQRSWQKSALLIGGSAAGGAGVGALIGGKKGAGIGALIGGGSAAIYDQVKRR